jgi:hypothetical protein
MPHPRRRATNDRSAEGKCENIIGFIGRHDQIAFNAAGMQ